MTGMVCVCVLEEGVVFGFNFCFVLKLFTIIYLQLLGMNGIKESKKMKIKYLQCDQPYETTHPNFVFC